MRRFDPDTVQNGHIYSSIKEEEVFIAELRRPEGSPSGAP